jgi:hypothetical protein
MVDSCGKIDAYDYEDGSMLLAWPPFPGLSGAGTQEWTADSTLVTADSSLYTADGLLPSGWTADTSLVTADSSNFTADGLSPGTGISYNVYVNGVLNQNVATLQAVVNLLTVETYNPGAIAPASGNSLRPQNMPPNGVVSPSGTYDFKIVAVLSGVEVAASMDLSVTVSPSSIMLRTPMKRLWPFPNTGLD